jgi:hypothetical protein
LEVPVCFAGERSVYRTFAKVIFVKSIWITLNNILAAEPEDFLFMLIFSLCVFVFLIALFFLFTKVSFFDKAIIKWQIKLMKKSGKLPFARENHYKFEEDYFLIETEIMDIKQKYAAIENILVSPKAIYIYLGAIQANTLPLSVFESEQQKEEFITFINEKRKGAQCVSE